MSFELNLERLLQKCAIDLLHSKKKNESKASVKIGNYRYKQYSDESYTFEFDIQYLKKNQLHQEAFGQVKLLSETEHCRYVEAGDYLNDVVQGLKSDAELFGFAVEEKVSEGKGGKSITYTLSLCPENERTFTAKEASAITGKEGLSGKFMFIDLVRIYQEESGMVGVDLIVYRAARRYLKGK